MDYNKLMQPTNPTPMQNALQANQGQGQPSPQAIPSAAQQLQAQTQQSQIQQAQNAQSMSLDKQGAALDIQKQQAATMSKALAQLNPKANTGNDALDTASKVGNAISTPAYAGYCQKFVDDQTGAKQRYATAANTWQAKVADGSAQTNLNNVKTGDVVEFAPDQGNGNMGHAAIVTSTKNGIQLKMATNSGVQNYSLKDWISYSGQTPQGFYSTK